LAILCLKSNLSEYAILQFEGVLACFSFVVCLHTKIFFPVDDAWVLDDSEIFFPIWFYQTTLILEVEISEETSTVMDEHLNLNP